MDDGLVEVGKSENWLVTFGDLMALLFALFVLINSFSEVDAESFKRNAGPIAQAFNKDTPKFTFLGRDPSTEEEATPGSDGQEGVAQADESESVAVFSFSENRLVSEEQQLLLNLKRSLRRERLSGRVSLKLGDDNILVRLPSDYSFLPGSAQIRPQMLPALDAIARTTAFGAAPIVISGHTDGDPISTQRFRSNWDLSAARAISVLHYFVGTGLIDPNRLSAIGYAETKPMADEDTAKGKALNRRVEIRIAQTDK